MKNSFLRESFFQDKSDLPKTFKDFQNQEIEAETDQIILFPGYDRFSCSCKDQRKRTVSHQGDQKGNKENRDVRSWTLLKQFI